MEYSNVEIAVAIIANIIAWSLYAVSKTTGKVTK